MKHWLIGAAAVSALALASASTQAGIAVASFFYQEDGDPNDTFETPQKVKPQTPSLGPLIVGPPLVTHFSGISGLIGGSCDGPGTCDAIDDKDSDDFYLFGWLGGSMNMHLHVDCTGIGPDCVSARVLSLTGDVLGFHVPGDLNGTDIPNLAAGNYILRVHATIDPPFSVDLRGIGPNFDFIEGLVTAPSQVPEPASMAVLGLGLAGLGLTLRRRRTA